jgi:hypothetical protein
MRRTTMNLALALLTASSIAVLGCGSSVPGAPGVPGKGGAGTVDPNTCGNYAAHDAGRKLKAFLEATVQLEKAVSDSENYLRDTCALMGRELGLPGDRLSGNTKDVCSLVSAELSDSLQVGIGGKANLKVEAKPAVCTVNVDAGASAVAECEARASADVQVACSGTCEGTCSGTCHGTCAGSAGTGGSGGECAGQCDGRCEGSCSGSCVGHAEVEAEASCKAAAEVRANAEATCTEPEVNVSFDSEVVVDTSKAEAAVKAIEVGLPRLVRAHANAMGPLKFAAEGWIKTARDLAKAGPRLTSSLGDQAMCVAGQLSAAAAMIPSIQVSLEVQVEVSAEVSGSAGGGV